jgi:signal transduction histidine kinase
MALSAGTNTRGHATVVQEQGLVTPTRTIHLALDPPQEVLVYADADRIGQVLSNYLSNALKYSAAAQPVEVRLQHVSRIEDARKRVHSWSAWR